VKRSGLTELHIIHKALEGHQLSGEPSELKYIHGSTIMLKLGMEL
jgi:hypothetical protein